MFMEKVVLNIGLRIHVSIKMNSLNIHDYQCNSYPGPTLCHIFMSHIQVPQSVPHYDKVSQSHVYSPLERLQPCLTSYRIINVFQKIVHVYIKAN